MYGVQLVHSKGSCTAQCKLLSLQLAGVTDAWSTPSKGSIRNALVSQVTIGSPELKANHMIQQDFEFPHEGEKYACLMRLLEREMDGSRILIFCETKRGCDSVTRDLRQNGWPALAIHGDKSQQERDWVLGVRLAMSCLLACLLASVSAG